MKLMTLKSPFWSLFVVALLVGLPFFCSEVQARGGGGFSGGSFRGGGGYAEGPRGGAVAEGPRGGAYAQTPRGGEAVRTPYGGAAARGPYGGAVAEGPRGDAYRAGGYYAPGYHPVARAAVTGLAVGTVVGTLPAAASALSVAGQRYYYDGGAYYQPCYQGTDVNYCVVSDPNQ